MKIKTFGRPKPASQKITNKRKIVKAKKQTKNKQENTLRQT